MHPLFYLIFISFASSMQVAKCHADGEAMIVEFLVWCCLRIGNQAYLFVLIQAG